MRSDPRLHRALSPRPTSVLSEHPPDNDRTRRTGKSRHARGMDVAVGLHRTPSNLRPRRRGPGAYSPSGSHRRRYPRSLRSSTGNTSTDGLALAALHDPRPPCRSRHAWRRVHAFPEIGSGARPSTTRRRRAIRSRCAHDLVASEGSHIQSSSQGRPALRHR